jgi:hypothetical protein
MFDAVCAESSLETDHQYSRVRADESELQADCPSMLTAETLYHAVFRRAARQPSVTEHPYYVAPSPGAHRGNLSDRVTNGHCDYRTATKSDFMSWTSWLSANSVPAGVDDSKVLSGGSRDPA